VTVAVTTCTPPPTYQIPTCPDDCLGNGDCDNVTIPDTCFDGMTDGLETDVDCGGPDCYPCAVSKTCLQNSDCLTGLCENVGSSGTSGTGNCTGTGCTCAGSGFYAVPNSNLTQKCVCYAGFSGNNCGIAPAAVSSSTTVIVASTLGAAAVVGIVIAVVILAGVCGGGAYAVYNKLSDDGDAAINSNPLYEAAGNRGINPLHEEGKDDGNE